MTARRSTRRPTSRRRVTRKRQRTLKIKLNRQTLVIFLFLIAVPFLMGASCGPDGAIWNDPSAPVREVGNVIDAHKQAGEDFDATVGQWGRDFAKGWSEADARRERSEGSQSDATPPPVPECDWAEFGPCDAPPPPEWFFAKSDTNTE